MSKLEILNGFFIGTSLALSCIAVAVVIGMIRLANTRSKGKNNYILQ